MKNFKMILLVVLGISLFISCDNESSVQQPEYVVSGKVLGAAEGTIYIKVRESGEWNSLDSATIENGEFLMNGSVDKAKFCYLTSKSFKGGIPLFIENSTINIKLDTDSIELTEITGLESQIVYDEAKVKLNSLDSIWQDFYYNTYRYMNDEEKAKNESYLSSIYDSAQAEKKTFLIDYIDHNQKSIAAAQLVLDNEEALGVDNMLTAFDKFTPLMLESGPGEQLATRVDIMKKTQVGQPLIDFTMNDTTGKPIKLSEAVAGKYVLVDFWAAWCGPCRRENPNVVANYEKYHDQGFDVFGVSFDQKKENWIKAINDDGLAWMQVSDLEGWGNAAGKLYGIRSIPQNILLDPEGIIIEKNLRGEDLGAKLDEIFAK